MPLENNAIGEKLLFIEVTYNAKSLIVSITETRPLKNVTREKWGTH